MEEMQILVGIALAILALAVGYGIYDTVISNAEDAKESSIDDINFGPAEGGEWPTSYRCEECIDPRDQKAKV